MLGRARSEQYVLVKVSHRMTTHQVRPCAYRHLTPELNSEANCRPSCQIAKSWRGGRLARVESRN